VTGERTLPPALDVCQTLCKITVDHASLRGGVLVGMGLKPGDNVDQATGKHGTQPGHRF